jgi:methionyl-tRNA synthetase
LNQLDTSAKEDNPEDIVAAWLRALGEVGMTTGRFYTIFSRSAPQIEDPVRRERFEKKRDADLNEIYERMDQVEIERAYRIVASLRKIASEFNDETVVLLIEAIKRWRRRGAEAIAVLFVVLAHLVVRKVAAASVMPWLRQQVAEKQPPGDVIHAFRHNTSRWQTILGGTPDGWTSWSEGRVAKVLHDCESYVRSLNERFTNPKGLQD